MRVAILSFKLHFFAAVSLPLFGIGLVTGCSNQEPSSASTAVTSDQPDENDILNKTSRDDTSNFNETTYDGLTLAEWRIRLKNLGPGAPQAELAIPGLLEIATDPSVPPAMRRQATIMLGRLGKTSLSVLPEIIEMLKQSDEELARPAAWAAKAISLWGPLAKEATPKLVATLEQKDSHLETKLSCLEALAQIGGNHADVIPALIRQLTSDSPDLSPQQRLELQMGAIDALALIGQNASSAVPILITFTDRENDLLRHKVVLALGAIGPAASPAATTLAEIVIFDDAEEVRREAALSLANLGPEGQELLVNLTSDEEPIVREFSITALGKSLPRTKSVKQALLKALDDGEERVQLEAVKVLIETPEENREEILRTVEALFLTADRRTQREVADLIPRLGLSPSEGDHLAVQVEKSKNAYTQRLWKSLRQE